MKRFIRQAAVRTIAALVILIALLTGAIASDISPGETAARELYWLGLMKGTGNDEYGNPNFSLDRNATRAEGLIMLIRLLGKESDALEIGYEHPFTDAGYADRYIGYAYANGITMGVSATEFGSNRPITRNEYITLVLRALGYSDIDWKNPYELADRAGLEYWNDDDFIRAEMAVISRSALYCLLNGQEVTLKETLVANGAVIENFAQGPVRPSIVEITVDGKDDLLEKLAEASLGFAPEIRINLPDGTADEYVAFLKNVVNDTSSPHSELSKYSMSYRKGGNYITFKPTYFDTSRAMAYLEGKTDALGQDDAKMLEKALAVHGSIATPNMSEYEQVKAFHDWLVRNVSYDYDYDEASYSAYGAFINGKAVCDGYTKAFDLLCYLSGIDCIRINGYGIKQQPSMSVNGKTLVETSTVKERHAWNKVFVDGAWYNIDVTWDDPDTENIRYAHFLVDDTTLANNHEWIAYPFWPACENAYVA